MEYNESQGTRQHIHTGNGHARHLDVMLPSVYAFSAALYAEQADRVRLVQVERDLATRSLPEETELRRRLRRAENNIVRRIHVGPFPLPPLSVLPRRTFIAGREDGGPASLSTLAGERVAFGAEDLHSCPQ